MLTRCFFSLLMSFFLFEAQASSEKVSRYTIRGKVRKIISFDDQDLMISEGCARRAKKKVTFKCMAFRALKRKPFKDLDLTGGKNPGAVICRQINGQIVWGKDKLQNELTFCEFPDESYVSTGSIAAWLFRPE